jgi:hypothetical protein
MEMGIEMMKKFMNPLIAFSCYNYVFFYGLIYSLIVGAKRKSSKPVINEFIHTYTPS